MISLAGCCCCWPGNFCQPGRTRLSALVVVVARPSNESVVPDGVAVIKSVCYTPCAAEVAISGGRPQVSALKLAKLTTTDRWTKAWTAGGRVWRTELRRGFTLFCSLALYVFILLVRHFPAIKMARKTLIGTCTHAIANM